MAKIVVVEDDSFLIKIYKLKLIQAGFDVILIGIDDIPKASACIALEKPDLVILDIIMPGNNGFDILRELKANTLTNNIPIVVLTVLSQTADTSLGLKLGAQEYIDKTSMTFPEVIKVIGKYLH